MFPLTLQGFTLCQQSVLQKPPFSSDFKPFPAKKCRTGRSSTWPRATRILKPTGGDFSQNLSELQDALTDARQEVERLQEQVEVLIDENRVLSDRNTKLSNENKGLSNQNAELSNENKVLSNQNAELSNENKVLSNQNAELSRRRGEEVRK
ncbi:hypothetical protein NQZ68_011190 [Dissostichus eleginoides]|nr:hypothetical protein NQZ68_011190 [Dissostichus eleginoides]